MCTTCGCGTDNAVIVAHDHTHSLETRHAHSHETQHSHGHSHSAHAHPATQFAHAHEVEATRRLQVEREILAQNDAYAARNRAWFEEQGILALNLVSSPGAGKTTLLTATIARLLGRVPVAVIEGDQQTSLDAERIRATGAAAVQINTGKGCHLDAHLVAHALEHLPLAPESILFIENVGNLVCPAAFDLGEAHKVVILSVTEGEDKPLKYPDMFAASDLMLINKIDLAPYVSFELERCIELARRVNPKLEFIPLSATTGEGFDAWLDWLHSAHALILERRRDTISSLKARIAALEEELTRLKATA